MRMVGTLGLVPVRPPRVRRAPEPAAAVEHMKRIAADDQASVVFVHRVDGTVDAMGPD